MSFFLLFFFWGIMVLAAPSWPFLAQWAHSPAPPGTPLSLCSCTGVCVRVGQSPHVSRARLSPRWPLSRTSGLYPSPSCPRPLSLAPSLPPPPLYLRGFFLGLMTYSRGPRTGCPPYPSSPCPPPSLPFMENQVTWALGICFLPGLTAGPCLTPETGGASALKMPQAHSLEGCEKMPPGPGAFLSHLGPQISWAPRLRGLSFSLLFMTSAHLTRQARF